MEDPGPVYKPYVPFSKKPDLDTEPDVTIVAINNMVVDFKLKGDVQCAVWDGGDVAQGPIAVPVGEPVLGPDNERVELHAEQKGHPP